MNEIKRPSSAGDNDRLIPGDAYASPKMARPLINHHALAAGYGTAQSRAGGEVDHDKPEVKRALGQRPFSTLTLRILAVNLVALLILVAGVMFLDQYRKQLVERELATLLVEARVFAALVSEGAVIEQVEGERDIALSPQLARQMVRRLTETTQVRSRLYNANGELLADSHLLRSGLGLVEIEELAPLDEQSPESWKGVGSLFDDLFALLSISDPPRIYSNPEEHGLMLIGPATQYVGRALAGNVSANSWGNREQGIILTAAAPVQQFKKVLGAVLLIRDGSGVDAAMVEVRRSILYMSMIALSVTVLLSLYLVGTIERPLRRLARAADLVRNSPGRTVAAIPDFTARNDEIGDLSLALREMMESLWQRMDSIEAFAADVAHEIKNPLTSLRSAVETAARLSDPDQQRKLMGIIQDDVRRLDRLISDISDASRLDAELSRADSESIDLNVMLSTLADIHRHTVQVQEDKAPSVVLALPDTVLKVRALEGRLVQVLQNLIGNAISFSPANGRIWLSAEQQGSQAVICVADEGPGIPEGKLDAIFSRFYSERPKAEKFGTHSGLGLSISKQIVEALNGSIHAENRYEGSQIVGARFIIRLPIERSTRESRREDGSRRGGA